MKRRILPGLLLILLLLLAMTVLSNSAAATVTSQELADGEMVLWNKLGSADEVQHSEIGQNFGISSESEVLYVPGFFGGAVATTGGENGGGGYLTMSPEDFFPADKTKGTVEVWIQKRIDRFIPFETPLVGIFGIQPYDNSSSHETISSYWSDGYSGNGGMQFEIEDSDNIYHLANDLGWDAVSVGDWVHIAYVWDLAGIEGTADKMRIYRDGNITATNTDNIPDIKPDTRTVKILGHHAYSRFGQPTAYLDNLKVWDYAKTDFSDRFEEGPPECSLDMEASYSQGQLHLIYDFSTGSSPVTWHSAISIFGVWHTPFEADLPAGVSSTMTADVPFASRGTIVVATTFSTPDEGIICYDSELVDTGTADMSAPLPTSDVWQYALRQALK